MDLDTEEKEDGIVENLRVNSLNSNATDGAEQQDMAACDNPEVPASGNENDEGDALDSGELTESKDAGLSGIEIKVIEEIEVNKNIQEIKVNEKNQEIKENEQIKDNFDLKADVPVVTNATEPHVSPSPKSKAHKLCADYRSCSSTTDSGSESASASHSKSESESESESLSILEVGSNWDSEDSETENNASSNDSENRNKKAKRSGVKPQSLKKKCHETDLDISELPPIEKLKISVPEEECQEIGYVSGVVDTLVVIETYKGTFALDIDTVLFLDKGKKSLGRVFDVIGPVSEPVYIVRFNNIAEITEANIVKNDKVYCAPKTEYSSFVFVSELMKMKGSDASWKDNKEVPLACQDFSDDEEERKFKSLLQNSDDSVKSAGTTNSSPKKKTTCTPQMNASTESFNFQDSSIFDTPMNQCPMFGMNPPMYPMPNPYLPYFAFPPPPPPPSPQCQISVPPTAPTFPGNQFCNPNPPTNVKPNFLGPMNSFKFNYPCSPQRYAFPNGFNHYFNFPGQIQPNQGINSYQNTFTQYRYPQQPILPTSQNPLPAQRTLPLQQPLPSQQPLSSPYLQQTTPITSPQMPVMSPQQPFTNTFVTSNEVLKPRTLNVQLAPNL